MSASIGTFFSNKDNFYCNIRKQDIDKYIVNPLYSPKYLIIDNPSLLNDYTICSDDTSKILYNMDKVTSHFTLKNENIYFLFSNRFHQDENHIFIPSNYNEEELKEVIMNRFFIIYKSSYKTMACDDPFKINITELKTITKTDKFLKLSMSFECFIKPHCIKNRSYEFKSVDNVIRFLQNEINIPKSIIDNLEINIINTF